jgi:hypothetical protein
VTKFHHSSSPFSPCIPCIRSSGGSGIRFWRSILRSRRALLCAPSPLKRRPPLLLNRRVNRPPIRTMHRNPRSGNSTRPGWLRAAWHALRRQKRRRALRFAPPEVSLVLSSDGHGRLTWVMTGSTAWDSVSIYFSTDGVAWESFDSWYLAAGSRDCSGNAGYFRICLGDWDGNDVPPYSNVVYSDGL